MTVDQLIQEMPKGLIKWYELKKGSRVLYVTAGQIMDEAMQQALSEYNLHVDCCTVEEFENITLGNAYDYAIIMSALERTGSVAKATELLAKVRDLLKNSGKLFLGLNNRLGIRFFCGDQDSYTGRNFDGIENYVRAKASDFDQLVGRCFCKAEIAEMLGIAGFLNHRFYSVFPVLERPQIIFAEDYTPAERLDIRIFPQYNYPDTVFLEEEKLYDTLIKNNLFHVMANAFWIECPLDGSFANANQVTMSMDRGSKNAMFTIIRRDNKVEKKAAYKEGICKIAEIMDNNKYLSEHGINMVKTVVESNSLVMPYVQGISAAEYLRDLVIRDRELFFKRLDELWHMILCSSEHISYEEIDWNRYDPYWEKRKKDDPNRDKWKKLANGSDEDREKIGAILKRGYIDLVPLNCFWDEGEFMFYDQELYVENLPAKVIMLRTIDLVYTKNPQLYNILSMEEVWERYSLNECRELFTAFIRKFLNELRNDEILRDYHKKVRRNIGILNSNRQRINYSADDYERIFRDIFRGAESRKLYLFGSGQFAERFLSQFGNDYEIEGIIDNNPVIWGTQLHDIPIYSPDILIGMEPGTYKVIICIKNYTSVMQQLHNMGIADFSIYDINAIYPRAVAAHSTGSTKERAEKKKYHVGYIAGVFDLFHIGHLNLLRRAKEQCDYLIVGVVTDEGVIKDKRTMPFVTFEERMEIVRSCKYVDEAVRIPPECGNTDEAYRRFQFDVQFSGSDYEDNPFWIAKKEFLQKKGSDLVFLPYTQSTSSTKIKDLINRKLL